MIVMDMKINNLYALNNFHLNMSYPKKIVGSYIKREYLKDRPNFRYKKVNILMGANATGKTSIGKVLKLIFNFMDKKHFHALTRVIADTDKNAGFSIDFVVDQYVLYRVNTVISPPEGKTYAASDIKVKVQSVNIGSKDSYESCVLRLEKIPDTEGDSYLEELEKIEGLSWAFQHPHDDGVGNRHVYVAKDGKRYT